jgi:phage terminase small subunit
MLKKIPTERSIYEDTISRMKDLGTHNIAFNRIARIYAGMVRQYYEAVKEWEDEGSPISTPSASGSMKKHPALDQMEKLRKDILAYSSQLMLNPKSQKESTEKKENEPSAFARFLSQSGGGGSG